MSVDQLVRQAVQKVGGGNLDGEQLQSYANCLQIVQQEITNRGLPLAQLLFSTLQLTEGVSTYSLGTQIYDIHAAVVNTTDNSTGGTDVDIERISLTEFLRIPSKEQRSRPTTYTTERLYNEVCIRVWPVPDQDYILKMYIHSKPDDIIKYTDTIRIPPRLYPAYLFGLAYQIGIERNGTDPSRLAMVRDEFEKQLAFGQHEDRERVSFFITPVLNYRS
jgi:hypothetical protein